MLEIVLCPLVASGFNDSEFEYQTFADYDPWFVSSNASNTHWFHQSLWPFLLTLQNFQQRICDITKNPLIQFYFSAFNLYISETADKFCYSRLCLPVPIDVVYTWVNGTDESLVVELRRVKRDMEKELNITRWELLPGYHNGFKFSCKHCYLYITNIDVIIYCSALFVLDKQDQQ